ncbi:F0F1 ATP synthase subunit gamma [Sulfurivirga sp.]|uniref:F0F1 ATP synthase subunit gamma n=1 Tax=Sulfurivirga sp. TaxID=2614236 RepID=UPI0025EEB963|nr:F0F1 ATP synthase subunit gamma [Sulfurivirga sp.]
MAGASKEIRGKINSIKNTQKITKAMEMVAAAKMRRAQTRMEATRPYVDKLKRVLGHVASAHPEYKHPYTQASEEKKIGLLVISSDRGLCGGLNNNLFRRCIRQIKAWQEGGAEVKLALIGRKAETFFKHVGGDVVASAVDLGDAPHLEDLLGSIRVMLDMLDKGELDALYIASNEFVNTMTQKPKIEQLVPAQPAEATEKKPVYWDYIYEPDAKTALDTLMKRYIEGLVYGAVVENAACEQSARMIAMKNATDNAGKIIKELQLAYNKARQAAITQEISEIVSGAAAIEG